MKGNFSRGNPDGPTLDGKELVDVHYYVPSKGSGHSDHALCNNGAYNIRFTENKRNVTCEKCVNKLALRSV